MLWLSRQLRGCPAGRFRFSRDRQVHLFLHRLDGTLRRSLNWALESFDDSTALLFAVDFDLGRDRESGLGELMFSPHDFGLAANLGAFDRDRGVGLEFGVFALL